MLSSDTSPPPTDSHVSLLELRTRAAQRRPLPTQATGPHTPQEMQRLVQELQVHQLALEMQNEELLLTQTEAEAARRQYADRYDHAPVGYFTLTETGLIEEVNQCGARLLGAGRQQLVRRRFAWFVAPAQRLAFGQFLARVFGADSTQSLGLELRQEDGTAFYGQLEGLRVETAAGPQCHLAVLDATVRQRATAVLTASEARFRKLFTESHTPAVLLQGFHFVDCNAAALRLLALTDRQQLVGQPAWAHTPEHQPDGRRTIDLFYKTVAEAVHTGSTSCEALMHRLTGEPIWVEAVLTPIELDGTAPVVHILWRDITAARLARQQLQQSKEFTESLLDNTVDGIIALDSQRRITAWNAQATAYFGQAAAAVLGRPLAEVLPYLTSESHRLVSQALAGERIDLFGRAFQARPGRYDAHVVPLYHSGERQPSGVLAVVRDVTERERLAEEATQQLLRQQQEVLAAILETQETERKRIAEALHNGLGQLLYATKLSLSGRPGVPGPAHAALKLLEEAIRATRTISFELTPGVLEDFGLQTAVQELVKRIAPAGLPVRLHLLGLGRRFPPPVEIGVYRTVQELLNNVMKHAHATEAVVHVAHENGRLEVSVEDNGRGFEPAVLAEQPLAGIGLAGVRNRVALLGGRLAISSRLGRGTIISFELDV